MKPPKKRTKSASAALEDNVLVELGFYGPFCNVNSGMGWVGSTQFRNGVVTIKNPRPFRGMPTGHPDSVGGVVIEITPEMVGRKVMIYAAIESKSGTGRLSKEQGEYIDSIKKQGGISGVARDPQDVHHIIDDYKRNK